MYLRSQRRCHYSNKVLITAGYAICIASMFLMLLTQNLPTLQHHANAKKVAGCLWFTVLTSTSGIPCNAGICLISSGNSDSVFSRPCNIVLRDFPKSGKDHSGNDSLAHLLLGRLLFPVRFTFHTRHSRSMHQVYLVLLCFHYSKTNAGHPWHSSRASHSQSFFTPPYSVHCLLLARLLKEWTRKYLCTNMQSSRNSHRSTKRLRAYLANLSPI